MGDTSITKVDSATSGRDGAEVSCFGHHDFNASLGRRTVRPHMFEQPKPPPPPKPDPLPPEPSPQDTPPPDIVPTPTLPNTRPDSFD
jgi:hypothetical protein